MEDVENDPNLWRSTMDEKTGQVYYYHKITRQSTWQKPACLSLPESNGDEGYEELCSMLSGLGTPEILIELLCDNAMELRTEALQVLLTCCLPNTSYYLAATSGCIDALLALINTTTTATAITTRQQALKALCHFASDIRSFSHFTSSNCISLRPTSSWDAESIYLLSLLFSLLSPTITTSSSASATIPLLIQELRAVSTINIDIIAHHDVDASMSLLIPSTMLKLSSNSRTSSNSSISDLPAVLMIQLYKNIIRHEKMSLQWLSDGAFTPLVALCTDKHISQDVALSAKDLLSKLISANTELRESILSSYLSLSGDISQLSYPQQQDPLYVGTRKYLLAVNGRCDVELRARGEGAAWRIPSTLLWSRCPGMRDVLEDYWYTDTTSTNSGLEISVDASSEILSLLVHYIRSNILLPLQSPLVVDGECSGLLEVLRVAAELQMHSLETVVIDRLVLQLKISYQQQSTSVEGEMQQLLLLAKELGLVQLYNKLVELCATISSQPIVRIVESVRRPSQNYSQPLQYEAQQSIQHVNAMFDTTTATNSTAPADVDLYSDIPLPDESYEEENIYMPTVDDRYDDTVGYSSSYNQSSSFSSKLPKPKSGGIYKLLLEQNGPETTTTKPTAKPKSTAVPKAKPKPKTGSANKLKSLPMEEFIPKRHSLEPPEPELTDAQKRMEQRAKPKHANKAATSHDTTTKDTPIQSIPAPVAAKPKSKATRPKTAPTKTTAPTPPAIVEPQAAIADDETSVDDSLPDVKASLKLLKMKSRRVVAKPAAVSDTAVSADEPSVANNPQNSEPKQQQQIRPKSAPSAPASTLDTSKCSRTSTCTCPACVIPIDALPIVAPEPSYTPSVKSNNTTATQRIREQRSKQSSVASSAKSEKWRHQSDQLRQAIAASRGASSPAPSTETPYGMVQCPHCGRKFNEQSGERHIPICAKTKARPVMLKSGSGAGGGRFGKK